MSVELRRLRLRAQRLTGEPLASGVDVVRRQTAVQSQDYGGAKWGLGLRSRSTDAELDRLFDAGAILRTHVLRPTWHFVLPEDARWLLRLTGPRVLRGLAHRHRFLELDPATRARALDVFGEALAGGRALTRAELAEALQAAGISPEGQRAPHLILVAELEGLVISGPRRGTAHTWALLEERVPAARGREPDEALAELTLRYFRSHGPAGVADFAWWSGLTQAEAKRGLAAAGRALAKRDFEDQEMWLDAGAEAGGGRPAAHLLPNFDEYTVAYRDRSALVDAAFDPSFFAFGSVLANSLSLDGAIRGAWRRTVSRGRVRVEIRALEKLSETERAAVAEAAARLEAFLGRPVDLEWL